MILGRRSKNDDADAVPVAEETVEVATEGPEASDRSNGPWDASEVEDDGSRMDLGGIRVRGVEGLQMQVQMDERTGAVSLVTLSAADGAVQIQAFAAPRSQGIWDEVRGQLTSSISTSGGLVEEIDGEFGPALQAKVPGQGGALQDARFVGVDGPRWFLRGLFLGSAAAPGKNTVLEGVFRDIVVVRGSDAMAPGDALPLRLPEGAQATKADG